MIWYEHVPEGPVENEEVKLLWDISIQYDNVIEAIRPDILVVDKKEHNGIITDIAVPDDVRVGEEESEKVEKYQELKREIGRLWKLKHVEVVSVVIGALRSVTKDFERWIKKTRHSIQHWSDAKDCLAGNCKNISASIRALEK